jgi:predicted acyltransferase
VLLHSMHNLHPTFEINKIRATAAWCLLSSAWTAAAWIVLFTVVEWGGWRRGLRPILVAGENALLAFLVPPLLLGLFALASPLFGGTNPYEALGTSLAVGTVRAIVFASFVVWLSGFARAHGLRMQL